MVENRQVRKALYEEIINQGIRLISPASVIGNREDGSFAEVDLDTGKPCARR